MRGRLSLLAVSGLVAAGIVLPSGPAAAAPVTCGAHLTANATLTADLTCPAGDVLTFDAGVTLDLNRHRLSGAGNIVVAPGAEGAVVRNGTLRGITVRVGEFAEPMASVTVSRVTMLRSSVYAEGQGMATVERSRFPDGGGVSTFYGGVRVRDSFFDGGGISGGTAYEASVTRSVIRNNTGTAMSCSEANCSIVNSLLENNNAVFDGWDSAITMRGNVFKNNGLVYSNRDAFGNATDGPDVVAHNRFIGNDVAMHIGPGVVANVQGNLFTGNGRGVEGHVLDEEWATFNVLLENNYFTRNGDAIYVPDAFLANPTGYRLKGNRAIKNTGWGIYAPRATDLGGNVSRGNGQQPQCVGVAC
jgi:hypothetical protein